MEVTSHKIKIRDLVKEFVDNDDEGCQAYGGRLDIRPKYQREFIYDDKKKQAVVESIRKGYPLSIMYWVQRGKGTDDDPFQYEILDGQQRTISICLFHQKQFALTKNGEYTQFQNLSDEEQEAFLDYELDVYFCEDGTEEEQLEWFEVINTVGEKLTEQELRNATYAGEWLTWVKKYFSKKNCSAKAIGAKYMNVKWDRQGGLERAIAWVNDGDIKGYMSAHQKDEIDEKEAPELYIKFKQIIDWVKRVFPTYRKEMAKVNWGYLYKKYAKKYNGQDAARLEKRVAELMADELITQKQNIYGYVLGEDERYLNRRSFDEKQKTEAYERQHHRCPICHHEGEDKKYEFKDLQGDHIIPWTKGGTTTADNCAMLCSSHNNWKSDKNVSEKLMRQWLDELAEMDD